MIPEPSLQRARVGGGAGGGSAGGARGRGLVARRGAARPSPERAQRGGGRAGGRGGCGGAATRTGPSWGGRAGAARGGRARGGAPGWRGALRPRSLRVPFARSLPPPAAAAGEGGGGGWGSDMAADLNLECICSLPRSWTYGITRGGRVFFIK